MRVLVIVIAAALCGCATYSTVEPKRTTIADLYEVEPQVRWSAFRDGSSEVWTVDGYALQSLRFVKGVRDGDPVLTIKGVDKMPRFRATMHAHEVMELVVDTLTAAGAAQVEAQGPRPARLGTADGFAFDLTYLQRTGLEAQALVVGAIVKERLHLIWYSGARQHYFGRYKDDVQRLIQSVTLRPQ
jgi:hypothetical protein